MDDYPQVDSFPNPTFISVQYLQLEAEIGNFS